MATVVGDVRKFILIYVRGKTYSVQSLTTCNGQNRNLSSFCARTIIGYSPDNACTRTINVVLHNRRRFLLFFFPFLSAFTKTIVVVTLTVNMLITITSSSVDGVRLLWLIVVTTRCAFRTRFRTTDISIRSQQVTTIIIL